MTLTDRQFSALARVAYISETTKTYRALKLVMCSGWTSSRAAAELEMGAQTVSNARRRMVSAHSTLPSRIALLTDALGDGTPLEMGVGGKATHKGAV